MPPEAAPEPPPAPSPSVVWESPEVAAGPAPGIEFAPHGARLVAYILDGIIIGILVGIFVAFGSGILFSGATYEGDRVVSITTSAALIATVFFVIGGAIGLLYFPFFWATGGSTLGMRPFNLRVVRDRDGGKIGWGTAILRLIGLWIAAAVFYIGFIWVFIDQRRRGWQDLIAGTVVIKQG
ncbi:MAG TPA: RDD family protein [Actinomycetota bacterium]|nr:RDD family protein [Actinomycetota bacterium]